MSVRSIQSEQHACAGSAGRFVASPACVRRQPFFYYYDYAYAGRTGGLLRAHRPI
jgi:hypothetical protein